LAGSGFGLAGRRTSLWGNNVMEHQPSNAIEEADEIDMDGNEDAPESE
jgi:hypothetical protein